MKITFSEKLIAYLTLFSGLFISAVAVYYSVIGLTAIFSAAVVPIIIMGVALEISKLIATLWLKQNWSIAPRTIKFYLLSAISILMLITSMGIFGFLSKAHNDQTLISGDVLSKLAVYDEKIKISKENIDANRKALKQLDEAVDQVMARSTTETGADKAVQIRRQQSKERARLLQEIQTEQKTISKINEERAPIAADIRKIEAEVGPLKYIAAFIYGETDKTILEKSVTWVIIIIVLVFDPLAVILLLASQVSFQRFKELKSTDNLLNPPVEVSSTASTITKVIDEKEENDSFVQNQINEIWQAMKQPCSKCGTTMTYSPNVGILCSNVNCGKVELDPDEFNIANHPYLFKTPKSYHPPGIEPVGPQVFNPSVVDARLSLHEIYKLEELSTTSTVPIRTEEVDSGRLDELVTPINDNFEKLYVQNEEQQESNLWTSTSTVIKNDPVINEIDYRNISKEKLEERINHYANLLREKRIIATDIPKEIIQEVKARV